ncbi:hypothetical protein SAY86_024211 [Trapa natans]|uniref:SPX domain-containing protein n=1 Tax=Trapa natans TaxID=22666 RepID=A0AAN7MBP3_TRANT|nr:hypothetical protein SAY86_024211 [Trapa natans]
MKFGKLLKQQIQETLPGWRDKFLSYKELKKLVRQISSAPEELRFSKVEADFVYLLNREVEKFNGFFLEKEEDFIIKHTELKQRIQGVTDGFGQEGSQPSEKLYQEEMALIRRDIVDFHGEMVLLMNYSNINYTGLAKILKKYDKRTGGLLRHPFIQKVLQQPFFTMDLVSDLIKECEAAIDAVFPLEEREKAGELEVVSSVADEGIFRKSIAALKTMQEIRKGSSTYGRFSLPPLNLPDSDLTHLLQMNSPSSSYHHILPLEGYYRNG